MRFITCFGGGAAVADDSDQAAVAARSGSQKQRRRLASSFRRKFLSSVGKTSKKTKKPSPAEENVDADSLYGGASTASSSVPSSAPLSLSSASSLSSSPCPSSVSSSSVLRAIPPRTPKRKARAAFPAAGVAAFVLCLLMVVLCGKIGATLLTSTALYLLPRRLSSPAPMHKARSGLQSPASETENEKEVSEMAKKTKVVRKGFFGRNRK